MPRRPRVCPGGLIYHVLNRAAGRLRLFRSDRDYLAFERIIAEAQQRHPIRVLDYVIMPNHWHFAVWPRGDNEVTNFFRWLAHTHSMRWHTAKHVIGIGPLYQGRFKSFPVENDDRAVLTVLRYMSRNPLRAGLVRSAIQWRWSGLHVRENRLLPLAQERRIAVLVNRPFTEGVLFSHVRGRAVPAWAAEIGCTSWAQIFLKWILAHPAVTCVIPATSRAQHLEDNMQAAVGLLPDATMRDKMAAAV